MAILTFPSDQKYYNTSNRIVFTAIEHHSANVLASIDLYTPAGSITFGDSMSYGNFNIGAIGGSVMGAYQNGFKDSAIGVLDALMTKTDDSYALSALRESARGAGILAHQFGMDSISQRYNYLAKEIVNPNTYTLFNAVDIRSFSFSFTLVPESKAEQEICRQIDESFRLLAYPEGIKGGVSNGLIAKFPPFWQIQFEYGGKTNKYLPKIHECFLRSYTANFNNSTNAFHEDGGFMELNIALQFVETKTYDRNNIKDGDYKDDGSLL